MWMHHDLAWWSFVLAILALTLMFPANLLANIVTPKLKNWWAERSVASTKRRLEKLEKELAEAELLPEISETGHYGLLGMEITLVSIGLLMQMIALSVVLLVKAEQHPKSVQSIFVLSTVTVSALSFAITIRVMANRSRSFRRPRSPIYRTRLRASIKELQEKLEQSASQASE